MEATGLIVSDYMEIVDPMTRISKVYKNGELIAEYKVEECDGCSMLRRLDELGYQRGQRGEKLLWLCGGCR